MTPPIGFRIDRSIRSNENISPLIPITACAGIGSDAATLAAPSPFADYAYRIAALTAGIALLATFI